MRGILEEVVCCLEVRRISWKSEGPREGPGDMGTSAISPNSWDSENGLSSGASMSDMGGIVAEGDWLPEPAFEMLNEGEESCSMVGSLSARIRLPGDDRSDDAGVRGCANPTRQLARLSR